ncbi:MAG: hypothetical protein ACU85V_15855 [Gammaproteobacteria bacterium]
MESPSVADPAPPVRDGADDRYTGAPERDGDVSVTETDNEGSGAARLLAYSFLVAFANDRVVDMDELRFLEKLALADRVIDDEERQVLRGIFSRVNPETTDPDVLAEIAAFRARYDI